MTRLKCTASAREGLANDNKAGHFVTSLPLWSIFPSWLACQFISPGIKNLLYGANGRQCGHARHGDGASERRAASYYTHWISR